VEPGVRVYLVLLVLFLGREGLCSCGHVKSARDNQVMSEHVEVFRPHLTAAAAYAQDITRRIGDLVADPKLFQVTPATIASKLQGIIELKPNQRTASVWRFTGVEPSNGVLWAIADFQPKGSRKTPEWTLLQIRIALALSSGNRQHLYEALESEIGKRVRKAGTRTQDGDGRRTAWQVGKYGLISLRDGVFQYPTNRPAGRCLMIEIAVLQGEDES
jgi:hypothetical protein